MKRLKFYAGDTAVTVSFKTEPPAAKDLHAWMVTIEELRRAIAVAFDGLPVLTDDEWKQARAAAEQKWFA